MAKLPNRRSFLLNTAALAAVAGAGNLPAEASTPDETNSTVPDGLNPPGIKVAGIKMIPVVGGKYKVWT